MITQRIDLSITPSIKVLPEVFCSQYDNGIREIVFNLYQDPNLKTRYNVDGMTAIVQGTKPDGNAYAQDAVARGSSVTVTIGTQMSAVAGIVPSEIVIYRDNAEDRIGSLNFLLMVEPAGIRDDAVVSDSEIPGYVDLAVKAAAAQAEAWANGKKEGVPVPSTDPAYHNNAKYWAEFAGGTSLQALNDVLITPETLTNDAVITYNSLTQKWENKRTLPQVMPTNRGGTGNADGYIRTGMRTGQTAGAKSTAEGQSTAATGTAAHAEGDTTTASGNQSHAEGKNTTAEGTASRSSGYYTKATGDYSVTGGRGASSSEMIEAKKEAEMIFGNLGIKKATSDDCDVLGNRNNGPVVGLDCSCKRYDADEEVGELQGGLSGTIANTAKVSMKLPEMSMYMLVGSAFSKTGGTIFAQTIWCLTVPPGQNATPYIQAVVSTQNWPFNAVAAADRELTITGFYDTVLAQFSMIRIM